MVPGVWKGVEGIVVGRVDHFGFGKVGMEEGIGVEAVLATESLTHLIKRPSSSGQTIGCPKIMQNGRNCGADSAV